MFKPVRHIYPKVSEKTFFRWNEEMFVRYNNERVYNHQNPLIRYIEGKRVEAVLDQLRPVADDAKILAAGCGEGYIEAKIGRGNLYLVDISKEAISRAKKKLGIRGRFKYFQTGVEEMPFANNYFDRVECSEVLEHVLKPELALKEIARVVKPEGWVSVSFPNEGLINYLKQMMIRLKIFGFFFPGIPEDMLEEWHLHAFGWDLFRKVSRGSLEIVEVRKVPFDWLPIRFVVKCRKVSRSSASLQNRAKPRKAGR